MDADTEQPPREHIVVVPYDATWPTVFDAEKNRLVSVFPAGSVTVEHIGSTAVPGLGAKPVVDMMLGAASLEFLDANRTIIMSLGYDFPKTSNDLVPERRYFRRFVGGVRRFHLHCVVKEGSFWRRHILFRDRLRESPETAHAYYQLKVDLAGRFTGDPQGYTRAKTSFIEKCLETPADNQGPVRHA